MSQWGGKPAQKEKADKMSNCTSHVALAQTQEKSKKSIAPGGQKSTHKNMQEDWPFNDNRRHQASVKPARKGYP